jgi:hypothetical protein
MKQKTWLKDDTNVTEISIYRDFFSLLKKQNEWKGEIKENQVDNSITLMCGSIMSLEEFLSQKDNSAMEYEEVEQLILDIGLQSMVLGTYKKGIFFLNLQDILVIDKKFFLLRDLTYVLDITNKEKLLLSYPMKINKSDQRFVAPELEKGLESKVLPFYASITVGYYSLAKICIHCLALSALSDGLGPIKGSKMYFFLQRCLAEEGERYFLYL